MATNSSEALHKLKEQLTCSICLEQYTNPKTLPCFHSFCQDCLRGVLLDLTKQGNYSLPCPTCRSPCELPRQQGVDTLPPSFTINNLTEVYNLMKKVTGKGHTSCDKCQKNDSDRYCKQCAKFLCRQCLQQHDEWTNNHETLGLDEVANTAYQLPQAKPEVLSDCTGHNKPLEIFCETCEELICQLCTVKKHKDHDYDVVSDAYAKHKLIIQQSSLQPLIQQINAISIEIIYLMEIREKIAEQGESEKQTTHKAIAQIKDLLDQTERKIAEEVDWVVEYKLTVTDHQINKIEAVLGLLTEWGDHIEHSLAVDTPHQVLSTKTQMMSHTKSLIATVKEEMFEPIEQANLRLVRNDKKSIEDILGYIGTIEYSYATPTVATSFDHTPMVGQESTINMMLSLKDGSPAPVPLSLISCHLTPPTSPSSPDIQCIVKGTSQTGQYRVVFTPRTRGSHQLHVQLHDRTILGNPVSIPVSVPVTMRGSVVKTITRLQRPYGVAVSDDGQVIISEWDGHCITIVTRHGERVRSFGSHGKGRGQLISAGIALTSVGTLLVVDCGNNRIQEFTMDGECISCFGSKGNGPLQFGSPRGIAINKTTGQVYVADSYNDRVQVLNADLTFSRTIGNRGSGHGQFDTPVGIAIDGQGLVYVADTRNHRIEKFTPEGQFVSSFGSKGSEPGQLTRPSSISVDNDLVYVSEWKPNHRMSVYTTTGEYVHCFGSLQTPTGSVMDTISGYLYVCDGNGVHLF